MLYNLSLIINKDDADYRTLECHMVMPNGLRIGRVNHYSKKSIKAIEAAYTKQVIIKENQVGKHTLVIDLIDKDGNITTMSHVINA